jgi:carbamate kinase
MGPKIESAIRFLSSGAGEVVITSPDNLLEAIDGHKGTHIVADTGSR